MDLLSSWQLVGSDQEGRELYSQPENSVHLRALGWEREGTETGRWRGFSAWPGGLGQGEQQGARRAAGPLIGT